MPKYSIGTEFILEDEALVLEDGYETVEIINGKMSRGDNV